MCNRRLAAAILILASLVTRAAAQNQLPTPTLDSLSAAAQSAETSHCGTNDCIAVMTVHRAMNALLDAQSTSQGITYASPPTRDIVTARRLDQVLLDHEKNFPAVCSLLTNLAGHYPPGDLFVAVGSIELALRMDIKSGSCLPAVLQAFPPSPQATTAIGNAEILCQSSWKLGPLCARIKGR